MSLLKVPIFNSITDKGVAYFFSNWANDTIRMSSDTTFKRIPSKFACVNLPAWQSLGTRSFFLDGTEIDDVSTPVDPNVIVPKAIQNYIENAISIAKDSGTYHDALPEAMFWKLMGKMGATDLITGDGSLYTDDFAGDFVTYAGNITALQHSDYKKQAMSQILIYIPNDATALDNKDWLANTAILPSATQLPTTGVGEDKVFGWSASGDTLLDAVYDTGVDYYTFGSNEDRVGFNFDTTTYTADQSFNFNAVLIYYDTYENDVLTGTQLGGILFTDEFVQGADTIYRMEEKNKHKSQDIGNALAYTLYSNQSYANTMAASAVAYNVYDSVSMDLYAGALQQVSDMSSLYGTLADEINAKMLKLDRLANKYASINSVQTINQQLTSVKADIAGAPSTDSLLAAFSTLTNQLSGSKVDPTFYNIFNLAETGVLDQEFFTNDSGNIYASQSMHSVITKAFTERFVDQTAVKIVYDATDITVTMDIPGGSQINLPGYANVVTVNTLSIVATSDIETLTTTPEFFYVVVNIVGETATFHKIDTFVSLATNEYIAAVVKLGDYNYTAQYGVKFITQDTFLVSASSIRELNRALTYESGKCVSTMSIEIVHDAVDKFVTTIKHRNPGNTAYVVKPDGALVTSATTNVDIPEANAGSTLLLYVDHADNLIKFIKLSDLDGTDLTLITPLASVYMHANDAYIVNDVTFKSTIKPFCSITQLVSLHEETTVNTVVYPAGTSHESILATL